MAIGDFHLHSTASDGVHSPTWVMERAHENGVRVLSLTDHDTTAGLAEAAEAASRLGMRLIPGMELSTDLGKADVHLLAYGFDVGAKPLQEFLAWQRDGRIQRVEQMLGVLAENGMALERARVFEIAGEATVGRPHVARALVERGYVTSVQEAFDTWLGNGKPADIDREKLEPEDAIRLMHEHGGFVCVGHPIYIGERENEYEAPVAQLAAWGVDGMEVYYKHYTDEQVAAHAELATRLGLAASGGSDYHGLGNPDDRDIGDIPFPDAAVEAFVEALDAWGVAQPSLTGARR